jgi:hypothetical protein
VTDEYYDIPITLKMVISVKGKGQGRNFGDFKNSAV